MSDVARIETMRPRTNICFFDNLHTSSSALFIMHKLKNAIFVSIDFKSEIKKKQRKERSNMTMIIFFVTNF